MKSLFSGISVTLESLDLVGHITSASRQCQYNVNPQMTSFPSDTATPAPYHPQDFPLTLPPHVRPHPSLRFGTPLRPHDFPPTLPPHIHPDPSLCFGTPLCSHDFPPTLPPHIHPHPSLRFRTPMAYHPHTPAAPS
ncbi:hypothetical protein O181_011700 [Austropuccinia psidii MF-1]|uniref:Uncharacterized protein n=1 Tax=Austropuccinia psidii MF-1 TaxID=1389203 RepID=A0A9Q3GM60_9BASI|nr:hypothetical protein [Austropuccinia psidii MF-1]